MIRSLLNSERLHLTEVRITDAPQFNAWERDIAGTRLQLSNPIKLEGDDAWERRIEAWNQDSSIFPFAIRTPKQKLVGHIALTNLQWHHQQAEMGLQIGAAWRGRGFGTEAIELVLAYAFDELNLHRVGVGVFSYNEGALRLYRRLGFVDEGVNREWGRRDGTRFDLVHLAILEPEWRAR